MYRTRMNEYYPEVIRNIYEFKAIIDSEYPEFEELGTAQEQLPYEAYIITASEDRIAEWEKILSISPLNGSTLEERRDVILARIRGQGKLNTALINRIVGTFTGGTAKSYVSNGTLYVEITPPPENKSYRFESVEQELSKKVPAHLGLVVSRNYLEWGQVKSNYATWQDVLDSFGTWNDVLIYTA